MIRPYNQFNLQFLRLQDAAGGGGQQMQYLTLC